MAKTFSDKYNEHNGQTQPAERVRGNAVVAHENPAKDGCQCASCKKERGNGDKTE